MGEDLKKTKNLNDDFTKFIMKQMQETKTRCN